MSSQLLLVQLPDHRTVTSTRHRFLAAGRWEQYPDLGWQVLVQGPSFESVAPALFDHGSFLPDGMAPTETLLVDRQSFDCPNLIMTPVMPER